MAIKTADAQLSAEFILLPKTGFIPYADGMIDALSGTVKALGQSSWNNLSGLTWGEFNNYIQIYNTIRWTAPLVDLGSVQYFTLGIEAEFNGTLSYLIHVSETGLFQGEETEYYIQDGDYDVEGFYGRFVYVTAVLVGTELIKILITANTQTVNYQISDVDSSTLSGTITNRVIELPTTVSVIKEIHIQPKAATSYPVNLYVSDTATSEILIPVVKSKSGTSPSFALYGIDNDPRDGIVDITVAALPRQAMFGGNLVIIS